MLTAIFGIASIIVILCCGMAAVWLVWTNAQIRADVAADPKTKRALSDGLAGLSEDVRQLASQVEAQGSHLRSLQGSIGAVKRQVGTLADGGTANAAPPATAPDPEEQLHERVNALLNAQTAMNSAR